MPTLNLGQVRPVYRGAWNSIDTYVVYDFVIYNGSAYLALKDVPANYEPPSQTKYWVLFGAKGEPGTPGEDGVDGAQGERGPSPAYRWDGTFLSIQNPDGTFPDQGVNLQGPAVPLSNSVTSTSETDAASSLAVKNAYDRGSEGITAVDTLRGDIPEIAVRASMPSERFIEIVLNSGTTYTAPADGFVQIVQSASKINEVLFLRNETTSFESRVVAGADYALACSATVPCRSGDVVKNAGNFSGTLALPVRFYYAEGSA